MLATGTILHNRYRIVKLVGQGGFGAVYRGWDMALERPVAVKEHFDTGPESQRQFEREAKLLAVLRHPNLPVVIDHFILPGQGQYLVMDFVEGQSLETMLFEHGGPLPEAKLLRWMEQVSDALEYLHTRTPPIIHRDIKPQNIIVTGDGRPVLVDFGISEEYDPNKGTTVGVKAVTHGFSPPEQYGRGHPDPRSDVYSLGATLYAMLTGEVPPEATLISIGADVLTPPREINPAVSEATSTVVVAAMATAISRRVASAGALRKMLRRAGPPPRFSAEVETSFAPAAPLPHTTGSACPSCGAPVQPGNIVCDNCGQSLAIPSAPSPTTGLLVRQSRYCSNCGAEVRPSAKFCQRCGHDLGRLPQEGSPLPQGKARMSLPETVIVMPEATLRLDAAVPEMVALKVPFDLKVVVRRMSSPPLQEDGLEHVRSSEVQVEWPAGATAIDLRVHVYSPGCHIAGQPFQLFRLRAGQDSPEVYFSLTPMHLGDIPIRVTLYQAFLVLGSTRLTASAGEREAGHVMTHVLSDVRSVAQGDETLGIYSLIMLAFSLDEVIILCSALGIDYDNLAGTIRQRKVSALVDYCRHRGLTEALIAHVIDARPNWMEIMAAGQ